MLLQMRYNRRTSYNRERKETNVQGFQLTSNRYIRVADHDWMWCCIPADQPSNPSNVLSDIQHCSSPCGRKAATTPSSLGVRDEVTDLKMFPKVKISKSSSPFEISIV